MDQILVSQLQRIEKNFALSTQILNDVILQQVQKHGENSQAIYESIKVSTTHGSYSVTSYADH
jgi:predicted nucleic acid-binding protein